MSLKRNQSGFTLLEIIIVIIIVGVLASLALPRLFSTVEFSRSAEALSAIATIRSSMERCYLQNNGTYVNCGNGGFTQLDIETPASSPNAHFTYSITSPSTVGYTITAYRNTLDGGSTGSQIIVAQTSTNVTRTGIGAFSGLK
ncbi:MAG TPA: type IV pilin protein [Candidatus Omnitrophota bacterium]|nr:type IV pilin protein [Candidatus Omnitrophota bacterium]